MTPEELDRRRTDLIEAWRPVAHKHPALAELGFFTVWDLIDAAIDALCGPNKNDSTEAESSGTPSGDGGGDEGKHIPPACTCAGNPAPFGPCPTHNPPGWANLPEEQ